MQDQITIVRRKYSVLDGIYYELLKPGENDQLEHSMKNYQNIKNNTNLRLRVQLEKAYVDHLPDLTPD